MDKIKQEARREAVNIVKYLSKKDLVAAVVQFVEKYIDKTVESCVNKLPKQDGYGCYECGSDGYNKALEDAKKSLTN